MRIVVAALVPVFCFAHADPILRRHLQLTDEQSRALADNNRRFRENELGFMDRINVLNTEIGTEIDIPESDPVYLGERYRGIESLCRGWMDPVGAHYRSNIAILDASQKLRQEELQSVAGHSQLFLNAYWAFMVEAPADPAPARGPFTGRQSGAIATRTRAKRRRRRPAWSRSAGNSTSRSLVRRRLPFRSARGIAKSRRSAGSWQSARSGFGQRI
jgi:hypothetical protein